MTLWIGAMICDEQLFMDSTSTSRQTLDQLFKNTILLLWGQRKGNFDDDETANDSRQVIWYVNW